MIKKRLRNQTAIIYVAKVIKILINKTSKTAQCISDFTIKIRFLLCGFHIDKNRQAIKMDKKDINKTNRMLITIFQVL